MHKLNSFIERNIRSIIIAATIVLMTIAVLNIFFTVNYLVSSNDECLWVEKADKVGNTLVEIQKVKLNGVTYNAGIRNGDFLLKINGIKLKNTMHAMEILNSIKSGYYATYLVSQNGKLLETNVYIKKLLPFHQLAFTILSLIWLTIGFVVIMAKPSGKMQRLFYFIGALWVITFTHIYLQGYAFNGAAFFLDFTFLTAGLLLPFVLLHFFWIFPKPFSFIEKKWVLRVLYMIPAAMLAIFYPIRIFSLITKTNSNHMLIVTIMNYFIISCIIAGLVFLIINYFKLKTPEERKPILIIVLSYLVGVLSVCYVSFIAPAISDTVFNSPEFYMPIVLVIIIPISFGVSIFKYQLMDVSIVIKNTIIYGIATISIAVVYFLIVYSLGTFISAAIGTQYQGVIAGVVFVIFAVVFQSTKDKFQDFLTSKFYPEQFAAQKVLMKFSNEVATVVGFNNILDSMKKTFIESLKINNFAILLKDKNNCNYKYIRGSGIKNTNLVVDGKYLEQYINSRLNNLMSPVVDLENFNKVIPENKTEVVDENIYTIIPMIIQSKIIGLMLFGLKYSGSQFAGKDLELLIAAANQAAISIENSRLYKSEAEKESMEKDLNLARKIQESLLPGNIPQLPKLDIYGQMIPAMQVGGDYFDLINTDTNKIFVLVGDVSGKGLAASLYMTKLQTLMRLACSNDKTPKEILIEVNKQIYNALERNWFITLTLALFDTKNNKVSFCRAGHMPVLVASNGTVNEFRSQGIGLGLESGQIFNSTLVEHTMDIVPGQVYVFYSDGITEAMNKKGDLFGENNLINSLKNQSENSAQNIINNVLHKVNEFKQSAPQNDDMTIVLVKVK